MDNLTAWGISLDGSRKAAKNKPLFIQEYQPEQFQQDIHDSKATYNAMLGSPGLGKTITGAQETVRFIEQCQGNGIIIGPTFDTVYDYSLKELRKWIPGGIFIPKSHHNKTIHLNNGRVIYIRSAEHEEAIDGADGITFIWIDEGDLIDNSVWDRLKERLMRQRLGISDKIRVIVTLTPQLIGGKSWVKDIFWQNFVNGNDSYFCRKATIWESRRIPQELKDEVERECPPGGWARSRYDAEWSIPSEGLIYPELPKQGLVYAKYGIEHCQDIILGVDCGYRDPFVACLLGRYGDYWTVFDEVRTVGKPEASIAGLIDAMLMRNKIFIPIVAYHDHDPNQINNVANNCKMPIRWINADKDDKDASIGYVRDLMILNRFQISDKLHALFSEFAGYRWKLTGTKQEPEHTFSHGPDAIRYGLWSHARSINNTTRFVYNKGR